MKSFLIKLLVTVIGIAILIFLFLRYADYSEGFRAGVPVKISKKGVVFKTWEGELSTGGFAEAESGQGMSNVWAFSIHEGSEQVIKEIEKAVGSGKRVKLYYKEKYNRFFWLGDTKYFVHKVQIVE